MTKPKKQPKTKKKADKLDCEFEKVTAEVLEAYGSPEARKGLIVLFKGEGFMIFKEDHSQPGYYYANSTELVQF